MTQLEEDGEEMAYILLDEGVPILFVTGVSTKIDAFRLDSGRHLFSMNSPYMGYSMLSNLMFREEPVLVHGALHGDLSLIDVGSKRIVASLQGHQGSVYDLAKLPSSSSGEEGLIASCGYDGTARIWDLQNDGNLVTTFEKHEKSVYELCYISTRNWLCTASEDHSLRLWDIETGSLLSKTAEGTTTTGILSHRGGAMYCTEFGGSEFPYIVSGCGDQTLYVYSLDLQCVLPFRCSEGVEQSNVRYSGRRVPACDPTPYNFLQHDANPYLFYVGERRGGHLCLYDLRQSEAQRLARRGKHGMKSVRDIVRVGGGKIASCGISGYDVYVSEGETLQTCSLAERMRTDYDNLALCCLVPDEVV